MVYFTEKLINEIRERSCIWDTTDVNHLNKEVLSNMWMEIAGNLYSDWNRLSGFDQRDRGKKYKFLLLLPIRTYCISYIITLC